MISRASRAWRNPRFLRFFLPTNWSFPGKAPWWQASEAGDVAVVVSSMRACFAAGLLAHSVVAQFGTIRIDWVSEGALGDGRATPHVGGLSAVLEGEEPAPPPAPSADTYEEAWWRDDFAHDPPGVWFGAATTQRGKRPASMVSTMSKTRPIPAGQRGLTG